MVTPQTRKDPDWMKFFCRHLIAICATIEFKESEQEPKFVAYSGTLIRFGNSIFVLTAGHILKTLDQTLKNEKIALKSVMLVDTFSLKPISDLPIPFTLKTEHIFYVDDDKEGLDFGLIYLEPMYVRLLAANGMVAIEEKNWLHQSNMTFDGYAMLGLPEEFTLKDGSTFGGGIVSPTMFRVKHIETLPEDCEPTLQPRFIGELDPNLNLQSVVGMSGGPIFGFKLDA